MKRVIEKFDADGNLIERITEEDVYTPYYPDTSTDPLWKWREPPFRVWSCGGTVQPSDGTEYVLYNHLRG